MYEGAQIYTKIQSDIQKENHPKLLKKSFKHYVRNLNSL